MPEDHEPIQPEISAQMQSWAEVLNETFNGKECKIKDRKYGFALLVFKFGEDDGTGIGKGDGTHMNYISNATRKDMIRTMKEFIARDALNN